MRKQMQAVGLDEKVLVVDKAYGGKTVSTIRQLFTDYGIDFYLLPDEQKRDEDTSGASYGYLQLCD